MKNSNFTTPQVFSASKHRERFWHAWKAAQVEEFLQTSAVSGLTLYEADQRLEKYGSNQLREKKKEPLWKEFIEELKEPLILLLTLTGILYIILGEVSNGIVIFVVILLLNTIEVINEQRAKKAILALQKLAEPTALILRDSQPLEYPVEHIVPGDVILLQAGRKIPADARLIESYGLAVDESSLTGESVSVEKDALQIKGQAEPLAGRINMVYSGTQVTRGRGKALVVGTGEATEVGRVVGITKELKTPRTPLQEAMDEVSKSLIWIALGLSVVVPLLGVLIAKQPAKTMILTGLSLAFATIPEEMPIIITMVLSIGGYRLSKQNAIVKNLKAVETLGAVTVIATDKTGTLTENRMQVSEIYPGANHHQIFMAGCLCNDAYIDSQLMKGDPLEIALINAGMENGVDCETYLYKYPRVTEFSFSNSRRTMSVVTKARGSYQVWTKGAPENILAISTSIRQDNNNNASLDENMKQELLGISAQLAEKGLRVIALAHKETQDIPGNQYAAENQLTFLGLVGMIDPPRPEVKDAILAMQKAGIRSIMITGDHPLTARAVAVQVGLNGEDRVITGEEIDALADEELDQVTKKYSIFARTSPENKLRIVQSLMSQNERVAVTGDGVNDAPALITADIGVAMGKSGSDVAREAGDIILADDNYSTIAKAIEEGRHLFENLKKGVRYYLAIKAALVGVMLLPVLLQLPVPFAPIQIILMELFMDLAAAAAFVAEPAEGDLMQLRPRNPTVKFMDVAMIQSIFLNAAGLFAAVSAVYLLTWYQGVELVAAQTVAFIAWMVGHVLLAFNMRSERQPILELGLGSNRLMLVWGAVVALFLSLVSIFPGAQNLMKTINLSASQWSMILVVTLIGTGWIEARKLITYHKKE